MMPHYYLTSRVDRTRGTGRWRFEIRTDDGVQRIEAEDAEPGVLGERLDLLTVVRALEALDQPSQVTLVDCSDYVWKGVRYGLPDWSSNGWRWEFFGQMVPVKNSDLWQRLDHALQFHDVKCRRRRFDPAHRSPGDAGRVGREKKTEWGLRGKLSEWLKYAVLAVGAVGRRLVGSPSPAVRPRVPRSCWPRTACH